MLKYEHIGAVLNRARNVVVQGRNIGACRLARRLCATAIAAVCASCGPEEFGPCPVVKHEPLFRVVVVRDSASGAPLADVRIDNIAANGRPFATEMNRLVGGPQSAVVVGAALLCTPECTFGFETGPWQMTFGRTGYRNLTLYVNANYSKTEVRRDCSTHYSGPVRLDITLRPEVHQPSNAAVREVHSGQRLTMLSPSEGQRWLR